MRSLAATCRTRCVPALIVPGKVPAPKPPNAVSTPSESTTVTWSRARHRRRRRQRVPRRRPVPGRQRQAEGVLVGAAVGAAAEHDHPLGRGVVAGDVEVPGLRRLARRLEQRPHRLTVEVVEQPHLTAVRARRLPAAVEDEPVAERIGDERGPRAGRRAAGQRTPGRPRTSRASPGRAARRRPRSAPGRVPPNSQTDVAVGRQRHRVPAARDGAGRRDPLPRQRRQVERPRGRRGTGRWSRRTARPARRPRRRRAGWPGGPTVPCRTTWRRTAPTTCRRRIERPQHAVVDDAVPPAEHQQAIGRRLPRRRARPHRRRPVEGAGRRGAATRPGARGGRRRGRGPTGRRGGSCRRRPGHRRRTGRRPRDRRRHRGRSGDRATAVRHQPGRSRTGHRSRRWRR